MDIGALFGAGIKGRASEQKQERKIVKLDDTSQMAQFGVSEYTDYSESSRPKVQWLESDEQREWRMGMDQDGRHQRVSQLSKETEGDSRAVSALDAEYRYDEVVQEQVLKIQHEQNGDPGMPKSGMLASAASEKAREYQNKLMLAKLDGVLGIQQTGPGGMERAKLIPPRTPTLHNGSILGDISGPLGNQLTALAAGRAKARGATPASPTGGTDGSGSDEEEETGDELVKYLRTAFKIMDKDRDGKVGLKDLSAMFQRLEVPAYRKSELKQMIFEVDDDCDGYMGWDDCSSVWVLGKQPLLHKNAHAPRQVFDLLDFLVLDIRNNDDHKVTGRVKNTKMLELFRQRYGNVSSALELTEETNIGDARRGISFGAYLGRSRRIHDAHFFADSLETSESLSDKKHVSRRKKPGYTQMNKEAKKKAAANMHGFIVRTKDATGFYEPDQLHSPGHLPAIGDKGSHRVRGHRDSSDPQDTATAGWTRGSPRGGRAKKKNGRVHGLAELYRWAGVPHERRVMLELACRTGDRKSSMIMMNEILAGYILFEGNSMAIVQLCDLLMKEVQKTITEEERNELLDLTRLVRESKSPAAMDAMRLAEERHRNPIMRDLTSGVLGT